MWTRARVCAQKEQQSVCCVNLSTCDVEVVNSPREPIPQQLVTAESTHGKCGADRGARTDLGWQLANHLWKMSFPWWHQQGPQCWASFQTSPWKIFLFKYRLNDGIRSSSWKWELLYFERKQVPTNVEGLLYPEITPIWTSGACNSSAPAVCFSNSDLFKTKKKKPLG